jgi:hypothetical protein
MRLVLQFPYQGERINLNELILNLSSGLDPEVLKAKADRVAKILNDEMLYLFIIYLILNGTLFPVSP